MKKFTKDMLRDEDIVMYKNGEIRIVKNNELYDDHDRPQFSIDLYDKDLKCLERLRSNRLFPMVKWEDEEPWLIEDLLKLPVKEDEE